MIMNVIASKGGCRSGAFQLFCFVGFEQLGRRVVAPALLIFPAGQLLGDDTGMGVKVSIKAPASIATAPCGTPPSTR